MSGWTIAHTQRPPIDYKLFTSLICFRQTVIRTSAVFARLTTDEVIATALDPATEMTPLDWCSKHKKICRRMPDPDVPSILTAGSPCVDPRQHSCVHTHDPTHTHLFSTVASQGLQWVWKTEARKRTNIWVVDDSVAWLVLGASVTHSLRLKWMFELGLSQILALPTCRIRCVIQFMP